MCNGSDKFRYTLMMNYIKPSYSLILEIKNGSHGSSSSIYISSTESAKQKVGTLVIGKNDLAINKDGIVDLDIGRRFIVEY
jgi:hypothetical protein